MRHTLRLLTLAALLSCSSSHAFTQTPNADSSEVMRQLLALPAPTPGPAQTQADIDPRKVRPPEFFHSDNPPPDDATPEDVLEYWSRWATNNGGPVPSEIITQRLLQACVDDIKLLPALVSVFTYQESTSKRIKQLYDKASADRLLEEDSLGKVKKWLVFNSKFFLDDLFALANKVKDVEKNGDVHNGEALSALARVDWETAEPLVNALAAGNQPRSSALAITFLYKQASSTKDLEDEEKYRSKLKTIASDRNAPAQARDTAIDALSLTEWSGRDDWYLSLLADETLREPSDGYHGFNPLMTLFYRNPDKWIPVMTRLVESKERAVQQAAAMCLVIYGTSHPRKDAILPVLRWLSEPDWLKLRSGTQRAWFIQAMNKLEMPESVPGLIWIVENEGVHQHYAARTLAHYKDPRAVPALKKALAQSDEDNRRLILEGLVASGGIPDSEAIAALEAYVAKRMTAEGREEVDRYRSYGDEPLPVQLSMAKYLASIKEMPGSLARSVLVHAESLKKTNPAMAQGLLAIANQWKSRDIDLDMINRIAAGTADADTIATTLERSSNLRENLGTELQVLLERSDEALGIGAVLLNDPQLAQTILTSGNQPAQIGLLAGARLTRTPLPVELVARLLPSKNALLALATERYLLAEDSKDARKLLWQHHPNEAFVTGWREDIQHMGAEDFNPMAKAEEKLRAELFEDEAPVEILALIGNGERSNRVLRIYADKAIYTHYEDPSRYRERVVSKAELATFKDFVTTAGLQNLGAQFGFCHHNCWMAEFVALRKDEAWRVFGYQGLNTWATVMQNFDLLARGEGVKIHYELEKQIKGLEVLYADETLLVKDVWQRGDEIRIFVERDETEEEMKRRYADETEEEDEAARAERRRKVIAEQKARFSWRKLTDKRAGNVVAQPEIYPSLDETNFPADDDSSQNERPQVQMVSADTVIIARNFDGLWKQVAGRKAVRISEERGAYSDPIVTPDGKWVVTAKTESDWSKPNYIIRFNLQTGREFRVRLDPASQFDAIAYLPPHDRVLLRRAQDEYDLSGNRLVTDPPEFYLLNAATGETQRVTGEFAPLRQEGRRFLQPSNNPHEFWAAIPDRDKNQTQVGRFSLKDFSFKPVMVIPQITFDSMSMWVDESRNKIYVVYREQLLSLPLKTAVAPAKVYLLIDTERTLPYQRVDLFESSWYTRRHVYCAGRRD